MYTKERKVGIVATLEKVQHQYLSIVVCRNPVEKLLSVFKVTQDAKVPVPLHIAPLRGHSRKLKGLTTKGIRLKTTTLYVAFY